MTKRLIQILFLLIFMICAYIFIIRYDIIKESIISIKKSITKEIIIPESNKYKRDYDYITFKKTSNFKPSNIDDIINIYFTILDNGWDEFTFYCDYDGCNDDVYTVANNSYLLSIMNNYVSPYNSYMNFNTFFITKKEIYIKVNKIYSNDDINLSENKVEEIINTLNISYPITRNDIKKIHDYIIDNTKYDKDYKKGDYFSDSYKSIGTLINGYSVCSGYADTLSIILDKYNIPNFKVSSEEHIWNVVFIDNQWLHIDVTWDDDENNIYNRTNFFLINTNKLFELDKSEHTFNIDSYKELNRD